MIILCWCVLAGLMEMILTLTDKRKMDFHEVSVKKVYHLTVTVFIRDLCHNLASAHPGPHSFITARTFLGPNSRQIFILFRSFITWMDLCVDIIHCKINLCCRCNSFISSGPRWIVCITFLHSSKPEWNDFGSDVGAQRVTKSYLPSFGVFSRISLSTVVVLVVQSEPKILCLDPTLRPILPKHFVDLCFVSV